MDLPDHPFLLFMPSHHLPTEDFWVQASLAAAGDPTLVMMWARKYGWHAVQAWGCQGHYPGSWPRTLIFHRDIDDGFDLAEWDGTSPDVAVAAYRYPTAEVRNAATDVRAFIHWKRDRKPWVEGIARLPDIPAHLRGPFSWDRLADALGQVRSAG